MPAIDTVATFQTTVASTFAAGVFATGDSGVVRNFPMTGSARLIGLFSDHVTTALPYRVRSPLLHDNVQGIRIYPGQTPSWNAMERRLVQLLRPQDTLTVEMSTAAATGKALVALKIFYDQLPGASARLHALGDISGLIRNIKPLVVTIGSGANTAGQWFDAVITTTEDLTHANTDYAVLGAIVDTAVACVAIKGIDTGNLRVGLPGVTFADYTNGYFEDESVELGLPTIPVINSANKGSTFVSLISSAATAAACDVTLILAELSQNLAS